MSLLIAILIGIMVGSSTAYFLFRDFDFILISSLVGIAGGIAGLVAYFFLATDASLTGLLNLGSALASLCGALVFALILNGLHRLTPKPAAPRLDEDT